MHQWIFQTEQCYEYRRVPPPKKIPTNSVDRMIKPNAYIQDAAEK